MIQPKIVAKRRGVLSPGAVPPEKTWKIKSHTTTDTIIKTPPNHSCLAGISEKIFALKIRESISYYNNTNDAIQIHGRHPNATNEYMSIIRGIGAHLWIWIMQAQALFISKRLNGAFLGGLPRRIEAKH